MLNCRIRDPSAVKPDDWDESEPAKIEDPNAQKPTGWLDDEEELIPDPDAEKPEDWYMFCLFKFPSLCIPNTF